MQNQQQMQDVGFTKPKMSPREKIYSLFLTKRYLFIAIFMSVSILFAVIATIQKNPVASLRDTLQNLASNPIFQSLGLDEVMRSIINGLKPVQTAVTVFKIIGQLPAICLATAFWFVFVAAKNASKRKLLAIGTMVFNFYALYKTILGYIFPVLGLVGAIYCFSAGVAPIGILVLIIVAVYVAVYLQFWMKLSKILKSIPYSANLNENMTYIYQYVVFGYWFRGITGLLGGFGGGFMGALQKICLSLVYIFIATLLTAYRNECGQGDPAAMKNAKENLAEYQQTVKAKYDAGEDVIWFEKGESRAPAAAATATATATATAAPAATKSTSAPAFKATPKSAGKAKTQQNASSRAAVLQKMTGGREFPSTMEPLSVTLLKLFDADFASVSDRYEVLGTTYCQSAEKVPVTIKGISILTDTVSGRRLLRVEAENTSSIGVGEVTLRVMPRGDMFNPLGVLECVSFQLDAPKAKGEKCLCEYGIVLPDDTTNGEVVLSKVTFEDGLFWDKGSAGYRFSSDKKKEFDKELYMTLHGEV